MIDDYLSAFREFKQEKVRRLFLNRGIIDEWCVFRHARSIFFDLQRKLNSKVRGSSETIQQELQASDDPVRVASSHRCRVRVQESLEHYCIDTKRSVRFGVHNTELVG